MAALPVPTLPDLTLWYHPACRRCERLRLLLEKLPCGLTVRDYLAEPPSVDELGEVLGWLDKRPAEMVRTEEPRYRELGLQYADDAQLLAALARHPELIERPIVVAEGRAALGRPVTEMALRVLAPRWPEGMDLDELLRQAAQGKLGR